MDRIKLRPQLIIILLLCYTIIAICSEKATMKNRYNPNDDTLRFSGEVHLRNIVQLTFGGDNAEAYWSYDNRQLVFQSNWQKINKQKCDQIFIMNADGSKLDDGNDFKLVSTGKGRTTCSYFLPNDRIIYSSTHAAGLQCPPTAMFSEGRYVWPLYKEYDIYVADADGSNLEKFITNIGYDAEATVSPDGKYVIFTSTRSGDLELWRYDIDSGKYILIVRLFSEC